MNFPKAASYLLLLLSVFLSACTTGLKPFTSDGCSSFPDGTFSQNELWLACCVDHDFAYWKGGTKKERELADLELEKCVASVGEKEIAALMLAGVRVGGTPYLPTTFRWGYGWPYPRSYGPLNENERKAIQKATEEYHREIQSTLQSPSQNSQ